MTVLALACVAWAGACRQINAQPEPGIEIRQQVRVCFRQEDGRILAYVEPSQCYSMACTRVVQSMGTAVLDQGGFEVRLEVIFRLQEITPAIGGCSSDCAGGGQLRFDVGTLEVGAYQVFVGDQSFGQLNVTSGLPWRDQCLSAGEDVSSEG